MTGPNKWSVEGRQKVLAYLRHRDGGLCGLCASQLGAGNDGVNIEHVTPKRYGLFDVKNGRAVPGETFRSCLNHVNNLQAAHDYCNKAKGNAKLLSEWRHPAVDPLPVAEEEGADGWLWVPELK